jgi:hypothetical protein
MYEELYTREVQDTINYLVDNQHRVSGINRDDLLSVAHETFAVCASKFNRQKRIKFNTFFTKSLHFRLYDFINRQGKTKRKNRRTEETELYNQYFGEFPDYFPNNKIGKDNVCIEAGANFCGRTVKGWKEQEQDLLIDITLQHMSRDAKQVMDETLFNFDTVMEKNFRPRVHMTRTKAKEHAVYDYFHDQGWNEHRITSAFREIRENLNVA